MVIFLCRNWIVSSGFYSYCLFFLWLFWRMTDTSAGHCHLSVWRCLHMCVGGQCNKNPVSHSGQLPHHQGPIKNDNMYLCHNGGWILLCVCIYTVCDRCVLINVFSTTWTNGTYSTHNV